MSRLEQMLTGVFAAVAVLNALWDDFLTLPVLYGVLTAASLLFGRACLVSRELPASPAGRAVPEGVRRRWCRVLGILFFVNAALCPLGFLLWSLVRFDQGLILGVQILGFLATCFASLIPTFHRQRA